MINQTIINCDIERYRLYADDRYFLYVENKRGDSRNDLTGGQIWVCGTFELTRSNCHINEGLLNHNMKHD